MNLESLFSFSNNTFNTKTSCKVLIVSSYLSGFPVTLDNKTVGHLPFSVTTDSDIYHSTVPFYSKALSGSLKLNQQYMKRHYFANPLITMIRRSIGMQPSEIDYLILELWDE